jgi:HAE1 family hydrophobic/amphiphilic exporter-1
MWIADVSIKRPVFAVMLIGGLTVLGWLSIDRIGVGLLPKIPFPFISVTTTLEGASSETVETEITDVVEEYVNALANIETLESTSAEGFSQIVAQFEMNQDSSVKAQEVRDKVNLAMAELPRDVDPPIVDSIDTDSEPVLSVMISGQLPIQDLMDYAERQVKDRLQRVDGVGRIRVIGGREREIRIWLDPHRLRGFRLTATDVVRAIRREHADIPIGRYGTQSERSEFAVKTRGKLMRVADFENIVVSHSESTETLLRDVARVQDGLEDERSYAELNGQPGIALQVWRRAEQDTVAVSRKVKEVVATIREHAPPGVDIIVARDLARFIEATVRDVTFDLLLGIFLVVLVTFAFLLSWRTTLIVSVAMPTAIVATFFFFFVFDLTINMLTLMALAISIGILVDDAVVVLESIQREVDAGVPTMQAAIQGVSNVGSAVIAGTLSVIVVFAPILFMEGLIGNFFFEYSLAVTFAISLSLLVSLTLTPTLCARALRPSDRLGRLSRVFDAAYQRLERAYHVLLVGVLRHRFLVILVAFASIIAGVAFARSVPQSFMPRSDKSDFLVDVELPRGTGVARTKEVARNGARALQNMPEVTDVFYTIGSSEQNLVNEANYYVAVTNKSQRTVTQFELQDDARSVMRAAIPGAVDINVTDTPWISGGGVTNFDVEYTIRGSDLVKLHQISRAVMDEMNASGAFVDVHTTSKAGRPEIQFELDRRRAADLGITVETFATTLRALIGGVDVGSFEEDGQRYDIRVQMAQTDDQGLATFGLFQLRAVDGTLVDLPSVAQTTLAEVPAQIDRQNRARRVTIASNPGRGIALGTAMNELGQIIAGIEFPDGYDHLFDGRAKYAVQLAETIWFSFSISLAALYMLLASQFNSFWQPLVIMVTAPLAFVGAFAALAFSGLPLTLFAQIGMIALLGLVMKNGILLVDYANRIRSEGASAGEAMRQAGEVRLRPILMTAISTIFGMTPIALATSDGAEWRNPMGVLIIGGLVSSTFLTLLVVPAIYSLVDDIAAISERLRRRFRISRGAPSAATSNRS